MSNNSSEVKIKPNCVHWTNVILAYPESQCMGALPTARYTHEKITLKYEAQVPIGLACKDAYLLNFSCDEHQQESVIRKKGKTSKFRELWSPTWQQLK